MRYLGGVVTHSQTTDLSDPERVWAWLSCLVTRADPALQDGKDVRPRETESVRRETYCRPVMEAPETRYVAVGDADVAY